MHKKVLLKLCKNYVCLICCVEKNRNIEHFFWEAQEKIVKSVHNLISKCYN